ncbi:hypothetical protein [Streptomyces sp. NPDC101249]|uniref:hypothetical protein n=1 Tax=Streptomyces sp. NPDC101249 TaxID=3366140 RepID=UPI003811DF4B
MSETISEHETVEEPVVELVDGEKIKLGVFLDNARRRAAKLRPRASGSRVMRGRGGLSAQQRCSRNVTGTASGIS